MRAFVVAYITAIIIAIIGGVALNAVQQSADKASLPPPLCNSAPEGHL